MKSQLDAAKSRNISRSPERQPMPKSPAYHFPDQDDGSLLASEISLGKRFTLFYLETLRTQGMYMNCINLGWS